jgi:hypothetical protein
MCINFWPAFHLDFVATEMCYNLRGGQPCASARNQGSSEMRKDGRSAGNVHSS